MEKTLELRVRAIIGPEMAKLQQDLRQMGLLGAQTGKAAGQAGREAEQGFRRADAAAKNFNGTIQNTTKYLQLIKGVISAFLLYRGFSFLTQQAAQFTRTLVDMQHQIGLNQTQLLQFGRDFRQQLTKDVLNVAGQTGIDPVSLAKTQYAIVSANIEVAESYDVLNLSAKAAVAGGLAESEQAFEAALSQVNTFGISFERAFDLQFQTLKRGIFNYDQFTTVVGTLSEAFASMGQSAETANAAAAAISQVFTGKQFERGATGLRNAVLRISEAPEDFEKLGIAVTDVNGDFRNFIEIAEDLKAVLDGMSSSARAEVIRKLFPDERERRGIGAFLGELDNAQQFFIEQQFAMDSMNEAYNTANDSLQTQANIFKQNLVPAMQPFVDMMSGLVGVFNEMDSILPGLNKTLLTTATIGAVLGSGALMTGGRFPMSRRFAGPALGPMGMTRMPTGIGYATAGLMGAMAFSAGYQPGKAGAGEYVGSALGGAATGAVVGGVPGAIIGGAVGIIAVALGDALGKEGGPVAQSFSEAFSIQLEKRAGNIAEAFTAALNMEIAGVIPAGGETGEIKLKKRGVTSGRYGTEEQQQQLEEVIRQGGSVSIRGETFTSVKGLRDRIDLAGFYIGGRDSLTARAELPKAQRDQVLRENLESFMEFRRTAAEVAPVEAARLGVTEDQFLTGATQQAVQDIPSDLAVFGKAVASGMGLFAQALADGRVEMTDLDQALAILGEGTLEQQRAFLEFIGVMESGTAGIKETLETVAITFQSLFSGDADLAADVFSRMGTEGEKLAAVFSRISRTMQAFGLLQTLSSMTMMTERKLSNQEYFDETIAWLEGGAKGPKPTSKVTESRSILESLGIDSTSAGQMLVDRLIADLGLVKGTFTTEQFVNALLADPAALTKVVEPLQLGANDFADALFMAADQMRFGLLESTKFTADQLEMFGEEFHDLNRMVRQRALLEQLKSITEFAGVGDKGITGAMDILRAEMVSGGKALFDLLSDPASLAELIAKMEFGDIDVDNSKDFNFVIRVSGEVSEDQIRALEETIVNGINRANREAMSG